MGFPIAGLVTGKQIICSGTPSPLMILTVFALVGGPLKGLPALRSSHS
jgi:hypothetical protein